MPGSVLFRLLAARIDGFVPPSLLARSPEDARRARLGVGMAFLMVPVFVVLVLVHLASGNVREAALNGVLLLCLASAPYILRATGRLLPVVNGMLALAFGIVVAAAVFARGAGITAATVALAEIPLFATLLGGVRVGAVWAILSVLASAAIGVLGWLHVITGALPKENSLYDDHASLVVIIATLFVVGVMYEFRKDESVRHIEGLEEERRRFDRERIEAKAEAIVLRSERLASMGRLAAAAAHEINNPLSYVANNLAFLKRSLEAPSGESGEAIDEALDGVDRIRRIVADLGTLSRNEPDVVQPVDVERALRTALKMAEIHTKRKARVETRIGPMPPVMASESRLVQAVLNLLVNAAQAIPEGRVSENEIAVTASSVDGMVVIEIRDTGIGIAPDLLGQVKEAFFTTKALGEGTGLGLTLADGIIRRYGGTLDLDSGPHGTTARVILEAAPDGVTASSRVDSADSAPGSVPRSKVLVVDDEPLVARAFSRILRGHEVTLESSGRAAVTRLLSGERFDVVFCDVMMPDVSGMGVHEALLRERPELAASIVFMTGGTFTDRAAKFRASVSNTFIDKPIDSARVLAILAARRNAREDGRESSATTSATHSSSTPPG
ncbi:MAG TPA: ATP-binding protein [Polyangiaceae bacterium]|nr:ATP-binding protein [Polyangiaceae bacterium]